VLSMGTAVRRFAESLDSADNLYIGVSINSMCSILAFSEQREAANEQIYSL